MRKNYYRSDFLFSKSSFLIGAGSILSIFSTYFTFNESESDKAADQMALESDFGTIGNDITKVLEAFNTQK